MKNISKIAVSNFIENEEVIFNSLSSISDWENNLGCIDGRIIGTGRSDYTKNSTEYNLNVKDNDFVLIDIPGIEGDERKYTEIIKNSLAKAHVIFYVNGSSKKVESDSLEKIKKYMHDGTSVYAIFNVHCNAKKDRIKGLDKTYAEELNAAYKKQKEIVKQTEGELKSFLGKNFKGSICVNGLLSFCSVAKDSTGKSTIFKDPEKNLQGVQQKFLKEYSDDSEQMQKDSRIADIQDVITEKIDHFDDYILEENLKKLKTRLSDILSDVTTLRDTEKTKIKNFLNEYDTFEKNCEIAKDDYIYTIRRIGRPEVSAAFEKVQDALFDEIEYRDGKIKENVIADMFEEYQDQISEDIQEAINDKFESAGFEYQEAIKDAQDRFFKDLERDQKKFAIDMSESQFYMDTSFAKGLGFGLKDFAKGAFKIAGYIYSGATIGGIIFPGVGPIVGAVVGFFVGLGFEIWGFFAGKEKRINKAKSKVKEVIDNQIDSITDGVKTEIRKLGIEEKIEKNHQEIKKNIAAQKKSLHDIEHTLDFVVKELKTKYKEI